MILSVAALICLLDQGELFQWDWDQLACPPPPDKEHKSSRVTWEGGWGERAEVRGPLSPRDKSWLPGGPGMRDSKLSGAHLIPAQSSGMRGAPLPLGCNRKFF